MKIIVTGGNSGVGKATAAALADRTTDQSSPAIGAETYPEARVVKSSRKDILGNDDYANFEPGHAANSYRVFVPLLADSALINA